MKRRSKGQNPHDYSDARPTRPNISEEAENAVDLAYKALQDARIGNRAKAIGALEAAAGVLTELHWPELGDLAIPLAAIAAELRELEHGGKAGELTRPRRGKPGASSNKIIGQAWVVLLAELLAARPKKSSGGTTGVKDAGRRLEQAGYVKSIKSLEGLLAQFKTDPRRKAAVAALRKRMEYELEMYQQRSLPSLNSREILALHQLHQWPHKASK